MEITRARCSLTAQMHSQRDLEKAEHYSLGHCTVDPDRRINAGESLNTPEPRVETWMSYVPDGTLISAISLPGTHDSAAYTYSLPFLATQTMDFTQQLNSGIRYFDLRCGLRLDVLEMVHGSQLLGLRLDVVLQTLYDWLETHSTEALIVQLKSDRDDDRSSIDFSQAIAQTLSTRCERWRTTNTTPSLGELRGRIQLFRRFNNPSSGAYGIDVTVWPDNPTHPFTLNLEHDVQVTVQDHYSFTDREPLPSLLAKKSEDVISLFDKAAADSSIQHWFMNFTSAVEFNWYYQISPKEVAEGGWWSYKREQGVNGRMLDYLQSQAGKRRYGIVAMDFPESSPDLIVTIAMSNFDHPPIRPRKLVHMGLALMLGLLMLSLLWKTGASMP